jgi:hypothetical protein
MRIRPNAGIGYAIYFPPCGSNVESIAEKSSFYTDYGDFLAENLPDFLHCGE